MPGFKMLINHLIIPRRFFFHSTPILCRRWQAAEDEQLTKRYEKYGPSWTLISFRLNRRTPEDCRKRHLVLSGRLESIKRSADRQQLYQNGIESVDLERAIQIPNERIEPSPFAILAAKLPKRRLRQVKRENPRNLDSWSELEQLVVREGYEQYGPDWKRIAQRLSRRTPAQVKRMMEDRFLLWSVANSPVQPNEDALVKAIRDISKESLIEPIKEDQNLFYTVCTNANNNKSF